MREKEGIDEELPHFPERTEAPRACRDFLAAVATVSVLNFYLLGFRSGPLPICPADEYSQWNDDSKRLVPCTLFVLNWVLLVCPLTEC